ncbi:MAG: YlbE-like family protein [Tenericutes bacterium]|nr:YlbE-like family protein [Mycoplasmatota bacterium]
MFYEVKDKLDKDPRFKKYLRENSNWYKKLNRDPNSYNEFVKEMKVKYKLRTIDKIDNFVDTVDLVTKIINISNE